MINLILKDLVIWLFGLFLDLMNYCADALLGLMNTDLSYFESNVPIILKLYGVFVAIGWGFLIGNCAFQCLKAMFAGLGFETESPAILLVRTFLFGFLLIMSKQVCEIGLSIGKTFRFGGNKTPGQKGDARVDNKNTAGGRNAANTARNTAAVGGKKNNPGAQKFGGKFTGTKISGAKGTKNTAWKPDKSFSHNPAGKRFGQTDTPPETKPEKAVENEPKQ